MNGLILFSFIFYIINVCYGLQILPFKKVPSKIAIGDKITIPISNKEFVISKCAALGNSFLYTEDVQRTPYSPIAYFKDSTTLELYIPEIKDTSKKYFIVVELPIANSVIKTAPFAITSGKKIKLPSLDGCGKNVKFSNIDNDVDAISISKNINNKNINNKNINNKNIKNINNKTHPPKNTNANINTNANNNNANIANIDNVPINNENENPNNNIFSNPETVENNHGQFGNSRPNVINADNNNSEDFGDASLDSISVFACAGSSIVALVALGSIVLIKGRSIMKRHEQEKFQYDSIDYSDCHVYTPKPFRTVSEVFGHDDDRDYQLKCLNDDEEVIPSFATYPVSLSDGSGITMDKSTEIFVPDENVPLPDLPISKRKVEEIVINPEKVLSETIHTDPESVINDSDMSMTPSDSITNNMGDESYVSVTNTGTSFTEFGGPLNDSTKHSTVDYDSSFKLLSLNIDTFGGNSHCISAILGNDKSRRLTEMTDLNEVSEMANMSNLSERVNFDGSDESQDNPFCNSVSEDASYYSSNYASSYNDCSCTECRYNDRSSYSRDSRYTDSRRSSSESYTNKFYEVEDSTEGEIPSRILLSTIEPFGESNGSFIELIESKQKTVRDSIYKVLPSGPIDTKPPKLDLEFVAQDDYCTDKVGELKVKAKDILCIVENLEGGYYMVSNTTTEATGKIPAHVLNSLL